MNILGIETSGRAASVCIFDGDKVMAQIYSDYGLTHGKELVPMIKYALDKCGKKAEEMDLFAVSAGPGSFTGIRIGISAAKALAWCTAKPCVGVSSLCSVAYNVQADMNDVICCVTDARGGRVYNSLFKRENNKVLRLCEDRVISVDDLTAELKGGGETYILAGSGAEICRNYMTGLDIKLAMDNIMLANGLGVAKAGLAEYNLGNCVTAHELLPNYLVKCQAERELLKKQGEENV